MEPSAFALLVSTAIQQAVELIEIVARLVQGKPSDWKFDAGWKRLIALAFAIIPVATPGANFPALEGFDPLLAKVIWVIALSAGTEGVNSILKFLTAAKENKKLDQKTKEELPAVNRARSLAGMIPMREAPLFRGTTRDRVVDAVEAWCGLSGFSTTKSLETLWNFHHATSAQFEDQGILQLCGDLADEFAGERNLTGLVPVRFKPHGGPVDTVNDLVEEVLHA